MIRVLHLRIAYTSLKMKYQITVAYLLFLFAPGHSTAQPDKTDPRQYNTYVLDNIPIAKTPRYLGLNVEVMKYADSTNLWDWLVESNAKMVRTPHPDKVLRKHNEQVNQVYAQVRTEREFGEFRKRINSSPENAIDWNHYLFSEALPWLGTVDDIVAKLRDNNMECVLAMAYHPSVYPEPILHHEVEGRRLPNDSINWSAAASAYEYYFACMYRYGLTQQVRYYMMSNEPPLEGNFTFQQYGILSKMANLALEDVNAMLRGRGDGESLRLIGPAVYSAYEEYLAYTKDDIDILDVHFYDTGGDLFAKKLRRALMRARQNGLALSLTEFGRIGGGMDIEQSLFSLPSSFQVAELLMEVLSVASTADPLFELALFYQFQFPATHRNYKSLVYGDMNLVDWTGLDRAGRDFLPTDPGFQQLQLRFATPAYDIYRMLSRCTPGIGSKDGYGYNVYELMEANRGVTATKDRRTGRNLWPDLGLEKYYANGGTGYGIKTVAVEGNGRLYVNILNTGPTPQAAMNLDLSSFGGRYRSAVVRETSLLKRDEPVQQSQVADGIIGLEIPAESFIQVIFTEADLSTVTEIRFDEQTTTPGNASSLKTLETTRLKVSGKSGNDWIDLSDLNIIYSADKQSGINVYSSGLVQRTFDAGRATAVIAKTFDGNLQIEQAVH